MFEPGKINVGRKTKTWVNAPDYGTYSKVVLWVDDETSVEAGDDTGLTLEADCPWATQEIAENVLAQLNGFSYRPYELSGAMIEPAAELGDAISTAGVYSGVYTMNRKLGTIAMADVSAPIQSESAPEIEYKSKADRKFTRKIKEIQSEFAIMADKISARVEKTGANESGSFSWSMTSDSMTWYANNQQIMKVDQTGVTINGTVNSSAVITGNLMVGGSSISAGALRQGAEWPYASYGNYTNGSYSLTGGGYGFNYNTAAQHTNTGPSYFYVSNSIGCNNRWMTPVYVTSLGMYILGLNLE